MLNSHKDIFSQRQTMVRSDFECYHYYDPIPPVVDFHEHEFYEVFFSCPEMYLIILRDALTCFIREISSLPTIKISTVRRSALENPMNDMSCGSSLHF